MLPLTTFVIAFVVVVVAAHPRVRDLTSLIRTTATTTTTTTTAAGCWFRFQFHFHGTTGIAAAFTATTPTAVARC